jgi:hypothetical protein
MISLMQGCFLAWEVPVISRLLNTVKIFFVALSVFVSGGVLAKVQPAVVGEVTMVIGVAQLVGVDGQGRRLVRGAPVSEGDAIETAAGGHVHLRFVDGGRLSVRPASRLLVENYARGDSQSGGTAIRFRLVEGGVRSITGAWGQAERERFRLNTPLAAIGVKGTDFTVSADAGQTVASVYTGAIVVTPMSTECSNGLGPCVNGTERLLSELMRGQLIAVNGQQNVPVLVAMADPAGLASPSANQSASASRKVSVASVEAVNEKQVLSETQRLQIEVPELEVPELKVTQLLWMRWPWTKASETDGISQSFDAAMLRGLELTATDGAYALMRSNADARPMSATEAKADFRLAGSSAQLVRPEGVGYVAEPVAVTGGRLSVDFTRSSYTTQLGVASDRIGAQQLASSGSLQQGGGMVGSVGGMQTRGSLSTDGREAGYFFSGNLTAGQVRGITLWGR